MTPESPGTIGMTGRCGLALIAIACLAAGATDGRGLRAVAGIGGIRKTGAWTPLVVSGPPGSLTPGKPLRVAVEDPDGQLVWSPPVAAEAAVSDTASARFLVRFGRPQGRVVIDRDGISAEHHLAEAIPSTEGVVVVYGDLPSLGRAARLLDRDRGSKTRVVPGLPAATAGDAAAPSLPGGYDRVYDAAEVIVVCGSTVDRLPPDIVAGIDAWVRRGGRLVVVAGASAAEAGGVIGDWLPGRFDRLVPLRQVGPLEAFARVSGLGQSAAAAGLSVPVFGEGESRGGVADVTVGAAPPVPLVVRRALGLGTVNWVGLDLDAEPLRGWPGCDAILVKLLAGGMPAETTEAGGPGAVDLAGQLRAALDSFAGGAGSRPRRPLPFELIAAIGLLYVACLYPFDWWLASRTGKSWIAWLSLPALAAAFSGVAWAAAGWWSPADRAQASCAEVVDVDAASGLVRVAAWAAVTAPENTTIDVSVAPAAGDPADAAVSWFADAGRGFGGLDAAVPHPSLAAADYGYGDSLASLRGVPIAAASSRLFEAEWTQRRIPPIVDSSLVRTAEGTLGGAVAHHLPQPLERCQLLHAGWLYDVGTLAPGQPYDTATGRGPRSLASALTRRAVAKERDHAARWDATSIDVSRILEVAGFHAAAGGRGYTALDQGRLRRLDLSPLLAIDRAVLVGTLPAGHRQTGWRLALDGAEPDVSAAAPTLCRIVIPLTAEPKP